MKTLDPVVQTQLDNPAAQRVYLVKIHLDVERNICTAINGYTFGGEYYEPGWLIGLEVDQDAARLGIMNRDFQFTRGALMGEYQRAPVKVWWAHPDPLVHAPILLLDGNISHVSQITTVLGIVASRFGALAYPVIRALPPIANFITPQGSVLTIGATQYRIESRGA